MNYKHNVKLTPIAKTLRKNMTKQERRLWYDFLKTYPTRICRQKVIDSFVVDFYCRQVNLVIELDGGQHYQPKEIEKDNLRTQCLEKRGLRVIRISNNEIDKNFEGVCLYIDNAIKESLHR